MKTEPPTFFTKARQSTWALVADESSVARLSGSKEGRNGIYQVAPNEI